MGSPECDWFDLSCPILIHVKLAQSPRLGAQLFADKFLFIEGARDSSLHICKHPPVAMTLPTEFQSVVNPSNIDAVPKLLSEVASAGNALSKAGNDSLKSRLELLAKARKLVHALETPREIMIQHVWAQVSRKFLHNEWHG